MPGTQLLRMFLNERLAAVAEEIFGFVEQTLVEYEDEVFRSKTEITLLRQQLSVLKPSEQRLHRTEHNQTSDENVHLQEDWNPILDDQQDQEPLVSQVKEEVTEHNVPSQESCTYNNIQRCYDQLEITPEAQPLPFDCSTSSHLKNHSDEEWQSSSEPALDLIPSTESHEAPCNTGPSSQICLGSLEENTEETCGVCGSSFGSRDVLINHLLTHKEVKFCHACCACFSRDVDLIRHMHDRHRGEKPFKCFDCGKVFLRRDNLVVHTRIHTGEKPFRCSYCGKSFAQSAYLCVHKRIHTGEKPYCCTMCGRRFSSSTAVSHCMKSHRSKKNPAYC